MQHFIFYEFACAEGKTEVLIQGKELFSWNLSIFIPLESSLSKLICMEENYKIPFSFHIMIEEVAICKVAILLESNRQMNNLFLAIFNYNCHYLFVVNIFSSTCWVRWSALHVSSSLILPISVADMVCTIILEIKWRFRDYKHTQDHRHDKSWRQNQTQL